MVVRSIARVAVFSGSNFGRDGRYVDGAAALGRLLAARGIEVVYGGTDKGLMGVVAGASLDAGGKVHGVITDRLHAKGHLHPRLVSFDQVATMRERKARMAELADAFIALPGGIGTLEEFAEIWTLNQLGDHEKPAGLLDLHGFWQPFMAFVDHMIAEAFLPAAHRGAIVVEADPALLVDGLARHVRPNVSKWM